MWYIAASYKSESESLQAYTPIQSWLKSLDHTAKLTASVLRIMTRGKPCVVLIGNFETQVTAELHKRICDFLRNGTLVELDSHTLQSMAERRAERMRDVKYDDKKGTGYSETHEPYARHSLDRTKPVTSEFTNMATLYDLPAVKKSLPAVDASKPLIVQFEQYNNQVRNEEFSRLNIMMGYASGDEVEIVRLINKVHAQKYKLARKYIFAESALNLHANLFDHDQSDLDVQDNQYIWIEMERPIETPYGQMRALYLNDAYDAELIERLVANPHLADIMRQSVEYHKAISGLEVVNDKLETIFDFSYARSIKQWVFLRSHKCLSGLCVYPDQDTMEDVPMISVCEQCREACTYFSHWLALAMAMINGEYALDANGESFGSQIVEYEDTKKTSVGKGKNKRLVNQSIKREVEYTVITYDVTRAKQSYSEHHTTVEEKRGENWLTLHGQDEIVYQKRKIASYTRHLPRKEETIEVQSHSKYVPMLKQSKKIVRIVASEKK